MKKGKETSKRKKPTKKGSGSTKKDSAKKESAKKESAKKESAKKSTVKGSKKKMTVKGSSPKAPTPSAVPAVPPAPPPRPPAAPAKQLLDADHTLFLYADMPVIVPPPRKPVPAAPATPVAAPKPKPQVDADHTLFMHDEMPVIAPTPKKGTPMPKPVANEEATLNDAETMQNWVVAPKKTESDLNNKKEYTGNYIGMKNRRKPLNLPQAGHAQSAAFQLDMDDNEDTTPAKPNVKPLPPPKKS